MGSNKFLFCHTMVDEFYKRNIEIFFDDEKMLKTVNPLKQAKVLVNYSDIEKALKWAIARPKETRFGLD
jgi:hypothetical protein